MKIESIEKVKRKKELYKVAFDDGTAIDCDEEIIFKFGLASEVELIPDQYKEIVRENEFTLAKKSVLTYIMLRFRPSGKIKEYMRKKKFSEEIQDQIMDYLTERGFINDREFGLRFIENNMLKNDIGIMRVKNKIREFGLDENLQEEILSPITDSEIQEKAALQLIEKKFKKPELEIDPKYLNKIFRHLYSKGYEADVIHSAIDQWKRGADS